MEYGSIIRVGYFDQMGESLDQELTVEEVIAAPGSRWTTTSQRYCVNFGSKPLPTGLA